MKNIVMYKKGEASWVRWIKKRIRNNLNFICLFQGPTGSSKTWSSLSLAYQIDPTFEPRQLVFDPIQLMEVINADWFKKKKWKIIIFDEPQITISNRTWQSKLNQQLNHLLSTFRHENVILIFASPYVDFLDSQSMKLLHCIFDCTGVNKRKQLSRVRPKIQQYNPYKKKTYPHVLYVVRNKKIVPLIDWYVPKPPIHLINQYEKDKTAFTTKLNLRIQDTIKELSGEGTKEKNNNEVNTKKPLTEKQEEVMKCLGKNTPKECVKLLNLKLNNIYFHKRYAEKKGYRIKEFS